MAPKKKFPKKPTKKASTKAIPKTTKRRAKAADSGEGQTSEGRSLWKGYITFGLVNIPVLLHSAEKSQEEVHFKLLDKKDHAGIKYSRINEETGEEVPWENIVKGYEYEPGNYAILTEEDFQTIARESLKVIEIHDFVNGDELGAMYFEKPYYLLPYQHSEKGYVLLRETLKNTHKVGIATIVIRSHQYLAAVMIQDSAIVLNTLRYPQEVKEPKQLHVPDEPVGHYKISQKEFDIAKQLVDTMTVKWDPSHYVNHFREDLLKLIEEKVAYGGKKAIKHIEPPIKHTNVIDFMALLKKSVKQKAKNPKPTPLKSKKSKKSK
ncbi:MAG: Ku protein [Candidatus Berkiellales bacterium]